MKELQQGACRVLKAVAAVTKHGLMALTRLVMLSGIWFHTLQVTTVDAYSDHVDMGDLTSYKVASTSLPAPPIVRLCQAIQSYLQQGED